MRNSRSGFTLIELMIVVVIIGILATIAIPKFNQVSKAAKEAEAGPILKQLYTLQERYQEANDIYATDITQLEGGAAILDESKYFTFVLSDADGTTYLACAIPKLDGLQYFTINQAREIVGHESSCG